jgi:mono/diheme cytochrome c family protein
VNRILLRAILWGGACFAPAAPRAAAEAPKGPAARAGAAFFEAKVRPVLAGSCLRCHGGKKQRGGLRLDSRAALLEGGEHGPAVVPGDPDNSLLVQAVRHAHEDVKMPPNKRLPDADVAALAAWVKGGAVWPEGAAAAQLREERPWAFRPLWQGEPPPGPSGTSANPIDRFIRARLREPGLQPAPRADQRTLIRRVTFDLTGLPPTPEEVGAFLADTAPDAWERLVERLLASPRYGERWGRHWLDAARYADTGGFEADHDYPSAWRYRDYVIRSLNADKPFDHFLQEQVAGDELGLGDADAVTATGLYCVGPVLPESAMLPGLLEYEWLTDAADTTGAAFLGLTFGCARCHDHKYDPLTQKDYYGLQAVFAASDRPFPDKVRLLRIKGLNNLLSDAPVPQKFLSDPRCTVQTEGKTGFRLFHRDRPLEVRLLGRGELSKARDVVAPALPAALPLTGRGPDFAHVPPEKRRAALARWLTSADCPLTARVIVNRVWGWHFGQALVRTPNDFGAQGEPPTHPDLLDWLARDLIEHGWSLKHLHRRILLSETYRMRSTSDGPGLRADADNRLLWHFPRRRLEGEAIRDAMLACAGTLNGKPFGPPVVPPLGKEELTGLFDARGKWPVTKDASEHARRSVYLLVRRTFVYPLFAAFDPPELMTSCPRRAPTVVPAQALTLLNSPVADRQSAAFARRLLRECGPGPEQVVARAWLLAFGRPPERNEAERAVAFLRERTAAHQGKAEAALTELCLALFNANEFVYVD